jgi:hypothetical protein
MNNIFTLEQWILAATKNLSPEAISSITKEITDHVKTTLEYQKSIGLSQVEAEKLAVRKLGDPEVFLRNARKTYLTASERQILNRAFTPKYGQLIQWMFFTVNLLFIVYQFNVLLPPYNWSILSSFVLLSSQIPYLISKKLSSTFRDQFSITWQFTHLTLIVFSAFLFMFLIPRVQHNYDFIFSITLFTIFTFWLYRHYPILRKLSTRTSTSIHKTQDSTLP